MNRLKLCSISNKVILTVVRIEFENNDNENLQL